MRRWVCVLVVMLLVAAVPGPARAQTLDELSLPTQNGASTTGPGGLPALTGSYSILDQILATPFNAIASALDLVADLAGMKPVEELVFNTGDGSPMADAFTAAEWYGLVKPWYQAVLAFATSVIVIQTVVLLKSYGWILSPSKRATVQEVLWDTGFAALFAFATPVILRLVLDCNLAVVSFGKARLVEMSVPITHEWGVRATGSALLDSLVRIADVGLKIYMNVLYLIRKFVLGVLLVLAPVVAWSWVSRRTRRTAMLLLSELLTNGMMTASHALTYGFFLTMLGLRESAASATGLVRVLAFGVGVPVCESGIMGTAWAKLLGFTLVIPVSSFLRRMLIGFLDWLGMHEEGMAGGAVGGMASLVALGSIMAGAVGGLARSGAAGVAIAGLSPFKGPNDGGGGGAAVPLMAVQAASAAPAGATGTAARVSGPRIQGDMPVLAVDEPGAYRPSGRGLPFRVVDEPDMWPEGEPETYEGPVGITWNAVRGSAGIGAVFETGEGGGPYCLDFGFGAPERSPNTASGGGEPEPEPEERRGEKSETRQSVAAVAARVAGAAGGVLLAGTGIGMRIGGHLVGLAGGPVGREIGAAGQALYDAGARMVRPPARRRLTADEARPWRQVMYGKAGETGAAKKSGGSGR
ncbi:MAG: hypothetical protein ACPLPR_01460 [Bacillota bacterium]